MSKVWTKSTKKYLNILQKEFPLEERPFQVVAERCGITEEEALSRIQKMKDEGIIRRIGAVFDGAKLGRAIYALRRARAGR